MGLQDLIITPIYLLVFFFFAVIGLKKISPPEKVKYFFLGMTIKIAGAILLGLIYQFYYGGGDTFNYWQGSSWIGKAFMDDPVIGIDMVLGNFEGTQHFQYYQHIWLRKSESAMFVVRLTSFINLFTFSTYSTTASIFALISFGCSWYFFLTLSTLMRGFDKYLFFAIFCIPSIIIWGSGLMKDSLTLSALLLSFSVLIRWIFLRRRGALMIIFFLVSIWILYQVKIYILIAILPIFFLLLFFKTLSMINNKVMKILIIPFLGIFMGIVGYFSTSFVSSGSERYSLENIPKWTQITAYDIGYWTGKDAGSGYSLGELDGTWGSMVSKIVPAIVVTLFRPFPWEVSSPLMALSAIESFTALVLFIYVLFLKRKRINALLSNPIFLSMIIFVLIFSFSVGVSTYNFGTLSRYKIPGLPFFWIVIIMSLKRNSNRLFQYSEQNTQNVT